MEARHGLYKISCKFFVLVKTLQYALFFFLYGLDKIWHVNSVKPDCDLGHGVCVCVNSFVTTSVLDKAGNNCCLVRLIKKPTA